MELYKKIEHLYTAASPDAAGPADTVFVVKYVPATKEDLAAAATALGHLIAFDTVTRADTQQSALSELRELQSMLNRHFPPSPPYRGIYDEDPDVDECDEGDDDCPDSEPLPEDLPPLTVEQYDRCIHLMKQENASWAKRSQQVIDTEDLHMLEKAYAAREIEKLKAQIAFSEDRVECARSELRKLPAARVTPQYEDLHIGTELLLLFPCPEMDYAEGTKLSVLDIDANHLNLRVHARRPVDIKLMDRSLARKVLLGCCEVTADKEH